MCGIIGIVGKRSVNQSIYDGLIVLQHRGQDAAGIVIDDNGHFTMRKDNGFVRDVFRSQHMFRLKGHMGIGHVRYPTAGRSSSAEAQPFYVNSPYGISLAHNGNLTNANDLKKEVFRDDLRHINTESDTEILLNVFAHELQSVGKLKLTTDDIFKAIEGVHRRCKGGYAGVAMIAGYGIVGFRDPYGIRPVVFGKRETKQGTEYIIASESVAIDSLNFELIRDIEPGEAVIIDVDGNLHTRQCAENPQYNPCIFEYVYFARPDSIIDGISVYKARLRMGEHLAKKIKEQRPDHGIDVVIPIPDTSRTSALRLSNKLRVKYREGFVKNRYIGRTFIMPGQQQRKKSVRQKLNAIDLEFKDKNVLLVDDSIVRGTTSREIIQMAREAGAKKVFFASAAPPVRYANVYGIDMPSVKELVGHGQDVDQICKEIGADWLIYQDLEDLIASTSHGKSKIKNFDISVFDGKYVTGDITPEYLEKIEALRNDNSKQQLEKLEAQESEIGIHNGS